ncbi:MAG: hypothetical protein IJ903_02480 [Ruminococcus sp.]|nr:hypothetical protein [Ruminococcus sp.]
MVIRFDEPLSFLQLTFPMAFLIFSAFTVTAPFLSFLALTFFDTAVTVKVFFFLELEPLTLCLLVIEPSSGSIVLVL